MDRYYSDYVTTEQFKKIKEILNSNFTIHKNTDDGTSIKESFTITVSDGEFILNYYNTKQLALEGNSNHPKFEQIYRTIDKYLAEERKPLKISKTSAEKENPNSFASSMKDAMMSSLALFEVMKTKVLNSLDEAGKKYELNNGLYYIVLIDLSGSTKAAGKISGAEYPKWIEGFIKIIRDALNFTHKNIAIYVKSIGDGSLFLFGNFDDIVNWRSNVYNLCDAHNKKSKEKNEQEHFQYRHKIITHIGEVYFNEDRTDTNSFPVSITFKIEKQFDKDDFGITEAVKQVITPEINSGRFTIDKNKEYRIDDLDITIPLWKLSVP